MSARAVLWGAGAFLVCLALPTQAVVINYAFPLTTQQEVPAPTIPGLQPAGVAFVDFNTDTNLLSWNLVWAGLTGPATAAHFHGPAGIGQTASPVIFVIGGDSGVPSPQPVFGSVTGSRTITDTQETQLLAGLWYLNIHTALNAPGEIRGQVIPEPATLAMLALGGLALLRRSRR